MEHSLKDPAILTRSSMEETVLMQVRCFTYIHVCNAQYLGGHVEILEPQKKPNPP